MQLQHIAQSIIFSLELFTGIRSERDMRDGKTNSTAAFYMPAYIMSISMMSIIFQLPWTNPLFAIFFNGENFFG